MCTRGVLGVSHAAFQHSKVWGMMHIVKGDVSGT